MATFHILASTIVAACAIILLNSILRRLFNFDIVATVPGPPSPSWIYGNMIQLVLAENYGDHEFGWHKQYGPVYRVKGCFGEDRLVVSDPQALKYILNNPAIIHSPNNAKTFPVLFGEESVASVHENHRRLRAAMNAGFSGSGVRNFLPVFVDVAKKVRYLAETLEAGSLPEQMISEWENATINGRFNTHSLVLFALKRISLPNGSWPICRTLCFGLHFASQLALYLRSTSLNARRRNLWKTRLGILAQILARKVTCSVSSVRSVLHHPLCFSLSGTGGGSGFGKTGVTPSQLVHQLPVLLLAGQDTSAAAMSWAIYWLAQNPEFQDKLREEILNSQEGGLDYDNMPVNILPVERTREMFPPAPLLERSASEDCVIPFSEIVTSTGDRIHELPVKKGQFIFLALGAYQRSEALWGPDANEFKPSRWLAGDPCPGQTSALGPYAHLLAFLGGHRVCVGWRFALLEMQVILAELVGKFSFSLPKDSVVRAHLSATQFPVDGEGAKGLWLSVARLVN
ncbi:cytochrome P450 [Mycena maculata]|uniref:Cytochrome P450 n=1 Tax=Mycena maculata TaxID=230809 RepID=A0AAD7HJ92_9AGAR|nr:cytochrome P450 [Mycena maculata]